jgi:hypothetical protein
MADLAARTMTRLGRPDALAAFADAIASFAHESAAANLLADAPAHHTRAWAVSAAVVIADAILISQWYAARRPPPPPPPPPTDPAAPEPLQCPTP